MKILHTADWHLGKHFEGTDFSLLDEQRKVLNRIVEIASEEAVDVVLIAGDIFDSYNPSAQARRLFYETVCALSESGRFVVAIAGNHDSPDMLNAEIPLYLDRNIVVMGTPGDDLSVFRRQSDDWNVMTSGQFLLLERGGERLVLFLLPYASEVRLREAILSDSVELRAAEYVEKIAYLMNRQVPFQADRVIGVGHIFMDGGEESGSERQLMLGTAYRVPLSVVPAHFDFMLLGHLHRYQRLDEKVIYSGSIFPISAREVERSPDKVVVIVDGDGAVETVPILGPDRVAVLRFDSVDSALREAEKHSETLVFLEIRVSALSSEEINRIKKAYGDNLIALKVTLPGLSAQENQFDIKSMSHEEIFREFYREKYGEYPPDELVSVFLEMLDRTGDKLNP